MNISGEFDELGNMTEAETTIGPLTIGIKRVWSRGSIFD